MQTEDEPKTETLVIEEDRTEDRFEPYRILRKLGEGGMGTVYLAAQEEPIRRLVALKVVKPGMDSAEVLARFNRERQALALMEHSSIARILDAGRSKEGRPYFVMEYVEGVPITRYCDEHKLSVSKRLALFLAVCRAVQHAHQRGVIHRDLKPSNILVAEQDGEPLPKVIDFGVAKAAGKIEDSLFTQLGQIVGTPLYASPEQADVVAGQVGPATDVYSLGVLLYELLVGSVPFDPVRLQQGGLAEMLRIIREEDPPSLPSKLTERGLEASAVAACRATNVSRLRSVVARDLDWVVRKALEKSIARRYASAAEFAADLERYLKGLPVRAAPPSIRYRASKLVSRYRVAAAVCVSAILAFPAGWLMFRGSEPRLTTRDTIVIADFANTTGDALFDDALRLSLTTQLAQSPYLSIQPDRRIRQILAQMKQPDARLTAELAREVCERLGSAAMVEGSIGAMGSQYIVRLTLRNCQTAELLDSNEAQAGRKEEVLPVLAGLAKTLRSRAGEQLATVQAHSAPVEATTHSLEALKAYGEGRKAHGVRNPEAIRAYQRAMELDPVFAMAYVGLGQSYEILDEFDIANEYFRKAYELRNTVTDNERFLITSLYERSVTGDFDKARATLEVWARTYPREATPHGYLSGQMSGFLGRYEEGIEHARKAIAIDAESPFPHYNLSCNYTRLENIDEAEKALARAPAAARASQELNVQEYDLAFLRRNRAGMEAALARSKTTAEANALVTYRHAMTLAYEGRLEKSRAAFGDAIAVALQEERRERAGEYRTSEALCEAFNGQMAHARRAAAAARELAKGREMTFAAALAFAMTGGSGSAAPLLKELEARFPEDTSVQFNYLPVLRARLALNAGQPDQAIEALRKAAPRELWTTRLTGTNLIGWLYPSYFRGLAYLAMGRPSEAATEFQKIINRPGTIINDPVGPAARLQLARAWTAVGDKTKAKAAYEELLELWRDADPSMPALVDAKAEAARL